MEPWVNTFQDKEAVYYLNKAGRERVGSEKVITKSSIYNHTLMRSDVYAYYRPEAWKNEYPIELPLCGISIVSDAVFMMDGKHYLLEVDNQQKMTANKEKLKQYKRFMDTETWQKSNKGEFPTILFYTLSDYRKAQLQEYNPGVPLQIITKKDLH